MKLEDSAFDASHYGLRIGRLVPEATDTTADVEAALDAARAYDVSFLRYAEDEPQRVTVEARGFRPVDLLVTSTLQTRSAPTVRSPATIAIVPRLDHPDDLAAVAEITGGNAWTTHLHVDPRLPAARTRALYEAWARNDVTGRAQQTITARVDGALVGYITVLDRGASVFIDLVAVAPVWHGKGIAGAMLAAFLRWLGDRDATATVGTQANNPALALYARFGFVPSARDVTYHLWTS